MCLDILSNDFGTIAASLTSKTDHHWDPMTLGSKALLPVLPAGSTFNVRVRAYILLMTMKLLEKHTPKNCPISFIHNSQKKTWNDCHDEEEMIC